MPGLGARNAVEVRSIPRRHQEVYRCADWTVNHVCTEKKIEIFFTESRRKARVIVIHLEFPQESDDPLQEIS